jgi:glycosyltransferase involved in cell wall biosynthesis
VLPTISDGFALTQLEAMSHGLPVITTPNCGEVVRDGIDGFVIPPADATALANALRTLLEDPERHQAMREEAVRGIERFSLDALGKNLRDLESRITGIQPAVETAGFDVDSI